MALSQYFWLRKMHVHALYIKMSNLATYVSKWEKVSPIQGGSLEPQNTRIEKLSEKTTLKEYM